MAVVHFNHSTVLCIVYWSRLARKKKSTGNFGEKSAVSKSACEGGVRPDTEMVVMQIMLMVNGDFIAVWVASVLEVVNGGAILVTLLSCMLSWVWSVVCGLCVVTSTLLSVFCVRPKQKKVWHVCCTGRRSPFVACSLFASLCCPLSSALCPLGPLALMMQDARLEDGEDFGGHAGTERHPSHKGCQNCSMM